MRARWFLVTVTVAAACATPPKPAAAPSPPPILRLGGAPDEPLIIAPPPPGPAAQIAVGPDAACARTPAGRVVCWGQWGSERGAPTLVDGLDDAVDIAVGKGHACARRRTGAVACWGENFLYWHVTRISHHDPVADVPGLDGAIAIGHGADFVCALGADHRVRCMGSNQHGELGDGTLVDRATPALVEDLEDVRQLAVGTDHACARLGDGSVRCWGANEDGQVGDGTATTRVDPTPVRGVVGAVEIVAGRGISCARAVSTVTCWGLELALRGHDQSYTNLGGPGHPFDAPWMGTRQIWAGDNDACGRTADGHIRCDGGTPGTRKALADIPHPAQVAFGDRFGCVLTERGEVGCWGDNEDGQRGASSDRPTPVPVYGLGNIATLVAGDLTTCAVLADRTVRCWGRVQIAETYNQLAAAPLAIPGLHDVATLEADQGVCAVTTDGHVACTPNAVFVPPLPDVAELDLTIDMRCARMHGGDVACWSDYQHEPRVVTKHAVQLAGTFGVMCARLADGHVVCWGDDLATGKRGPEVPVATPVAGLVATEIAVAADHACAIVRGGRVECWGDGAYGARGDGKEGGPAATPVAVVGIANAVALAAGAYHTCALLATKTVRCWGWNRDGQIGDGTFVDALVPHDVVGLADVVQIVAHGSQACARLADGTARCWGNGEQGQLGEATDGFEPHEHVVPVTW